MTPCGFCIKTRPLDRLRPSGPVGFPAGRSFFQVCAGRPAGSGAISCRRYGAVFVHTLMKCLFSRRRRLSGLVFW